MATEDLRKEAELVTLTDLLNNTHRAAAMPLMVHLPANTPRRHMRFPLEKKRSDPDSIISVPGTAFLVAYVVPDKGLILGLHCGNPCVFYQPVVRYFPPQPEAVLPSTFARDVWSPVMAAPRLLLMHYTASIAGLNEAERFILRPLPPLPPGEEERKSDSPSDLPLPPPFEGATCVFNSTLLVNDQDYGTFCLWMDDAESKPETKTICGALFRGGRWHTFAYPSPTYTTWDASWDAATAAEAMATASKAKAEAAALLEFNEDLALAVQTGDLDEAAGSGTGAGDTVTSG